MTKKLLTLAGAFLALLLAVTGCNNNEPQLLDPLAKVTINVKETAPRASETAENPNHYSPRELVEKTVAMIYDLPEKDISAVTGTDLRFSLNDNTFKDIPNAQFKLYGDFILYKEKDGSVTLVDTFFKARNCHFVEETDENDTGLKIIGYLPREVMENAWKIIKPAYDRGDYETVYKTFNEAYVAYPCTPEEYEELKAQGKV
ncbi:MAG: hypothetical protein MR609_00195 [Bacteroidales bacterium]|nr:hypothetical protein [Bacteroidales bacterium]